MLATHMAGTHKEEERRGMGEWGRGERKRKNVPPLFGGNSN